MIRRADRGPETTWKSLLDVLWATEGYEDRLEALLDQVVELGEMPDCHLYLVDESGRRFHLERTRSGARTPGDRPGPDGSDLGGGGVESMMPDAPPLELPRGDDDDQDRVVTTPAGRLWSVPLAVDGELVGLLRTGPVPRHGVPGPVRRRLELARFPLALALRQARREETLRQRLASVSARVEVGRRLQVSAVELDRFVGLLLELALRATRTEAGFVAIVDPATSRLAVRVESGMPPGFAEEVDLSPRTGLFDWSPASEGGALVLRDFDRAARWGIHSMLAVPLLEEQQPLGIFSLVSFGGGGRFDEHSLDLLGTFAEQVKLMLHNAQLFRQFADRYLGTVRGLARSLDARRPHTQGYHDRVSRVAGALAQQVGVTPEQLTAVREAGLIHDVGMAGIVEFEGGFQADLEHPTVGAGLVEHLPVHPWVPESVATHHEWFDGWGSPRGLKGEEIPLGGRILGLAAFAVEMAAGDPVRPPWPMSRLVDEVWRRRGSQFDPEVADVALPLLPGLEGELRTAPQEP